MRGSLFCRVAVLVGAFAWAAFSEAADPWWFKDGFNHYAANSNIAPSGGWETWTGNNLVGNAQCVSVPSIRSTRFVSLYRDSDLVHRFPGFSSGKYVFHASWWNPGPSVTSTSYLILLNTFSPPSTFNWSVQVGFSNGNAFWISAGSLQETPGNPSLPIGGGPGTLAIGPGWRDVVCMIDLAANDVATYVDGKLLAKHPWRSTGLSANQIAAVNLYAQSDHPNFQQAYYDDICLVKDVPIVLREGLKDNFSSTYPSGDPFEAPFRTTDLQAAFPASPWKNFDDPTLNKHIGLSWAAVPVKAGIFRGQMSTKMQPAGGGSENDVLYMGLNPAGLRPPTMAYGTSIINLADASGSWSFGNSAKTFTFNLDNMPAGNGIPAGLNLMSFFSGATPYTGAFDALVQDDTKMDWAELKLWACSPWWSGLLFDDLDGATIQPGTGDTLQVQTTSPNQGIRLMSPQSGGIGVLFENGSGVWDPGRWVETRAFGHGPNGSEVQLFRVKRYVEPDGTPLVDYDFTPVSSRVTSTLLDPLGQVLSTQSSGGSGITPLGDPPTCPQYWEWVKFDPKTQQYWYGQGCTSNTPGWHPDNLLSAPTNTLFRSGAPTEISALEIRFSHPVTVRLKQLSSGGSSSSLDGGAATRPLGQAVLSSNASGMMISNFSSSGNDGLAYAVAGSQTWSATYSQIGGESAPANGSRRTTRMFGLLDGQDGRLQGSISRLFDAGGFGLSADFSPGGATTAWLRAYSGGTQVLADNAAPVTNLGRINVYEPNGVGESNGIYGGMIALTFPNLVPHTYGGITRNVDRIEISYIPVGHERGPVQEIHTMGTNLGEFTVDAIELMRQVSGSVTLEDYDPNEAGTSVQIELRAVGGTNTSESHNVTLGSNGSFQFTTDLSGPIDLSVKHGHWLRRNKTAYLTTAGTSGIQISLKNGDCDGDNEISIGDYAQLSASYGTSVGDPGYDADADLNGDESVDIADYAILSANYGLSGDE